MTKLIVFLAAVAFSPLAIAENAKRPNVIVIVADDLGYADIAEAKDLAGEKPDLVEQLRKGHEAWNAGMIAPIFESPRAPAKKAAVKVEAK